jgi:hypothetical protein
MQRVGDAVVADPAAIAVRSLPEARMIGLFPA